MKEAGGAPQIEFSPNDHDVLVNFGDKIVLVDSITGETKRRFEGRWGHFTPEGEVLTTSAAGVRLFDKKTGAQIHEPRVGVWSTTITPDGRYAFSNMNSSIKVSDRQTGNVLCTLLGFCDGGWAVVDSEGRFDASNSGKVEGLHWVVGLEPIALAQLKKRYYDPGLLAKKLGFNPEPLRDVSAFTNPKLYPKLTWADEGSQSRGGAREPTNSTKLALHLKNQGGGIGKVVVLVNGKEVAGDARGPGIDVEADEARIDLDLSDCKFLMPGKDNIVEVYAYNTEGYLSSRGLTRVIHPKAPTKQRQPEFWAIVAGISDYDDGGGYHPGRSLDLRFAGRDAVSMASALRRGANNLFGPDKVHFALLTTENVSGGPLKDVFVGPPTRLNLLRAFQNAEHSHPEDVLVVYLAGHGVNYGGQDGDFYYLTREARSADLTDPEIRRATALSSREMTELIKQVPALKQIMILDTCASGRVAQQLLDLSAKRGVSSSQIRAMERLKDRTGFHVLTGCAADAVSYEASRYGQGLLTYALLSGMRGACLREGTFVDITPLFQFARDQVPALAGSIGGIQRPVIASPRGGASFDIGRLLEADQASIPLAHVRPMMVLAKFMDQDVGVDQIGLERVINDRIREVASESDNAKWTVVEASECPDTYKVSGFYRVTDDRVEANITLSYSEVAAREPGQPGAPSIQRRPSARFRVTGTRDNLAGLAAEIMRVAQHHVEAAEAKRAEP